MTDADLLPCPFCAFSAKATQVNLVPEQSGESWDVWCESCEAMMADFRSRESAVAAWNRRDTKQETV